MLWALIVAGALDALAILFFFQTRDPMVVFFGAVLTAMIVLVAFLVDLARRGIPVRVVQDPPAK